MSNTNAYLVVIWRSPDGDKRTRDVKTLKRARELLAYAVSRGCHGVVVHGCETINPRVIERS